MDSEFSNKPNVLVVDDEPSIRKVFTLVLQDMANVITAAEGFEALAKLREQRPEIALLDIRMPGMSGLELLKKIREIDQDIQIIMVTGVKELETAVESIKLGAYHYITKPFDVDELRSLVQEVLVLRRSCFSLKENNLSYENLILRGESLEFRKIIEEIEKNSQLDTNLLILGEPGTEKELVAYEIHSRSSRKNSRLLKISLTEENFSGSSQKFKDNLFAKTKLTSAGTVVLEGVEELNPDSQNLLFEVLTEEPRPNVRFITLTSADLKSLVEGGSLREDLFYLLSMVTIRVPALRERKQDLPILIKEYLAKYFLDFNKEISGLSGEVGELFLRYNWPGNLEELAATLKILVLGSCERLITLGELPLNFLLNLKAEEGEWLKTAKMNEPDLLDRFKRIFTQKTCQHFEGDVQKTSQFLGIGLDEVNQILKK